MNVETFIKWCQNLLGQGEAKVKKSSLDSLFIGRVWYLKNKKEKLLYVDIEEDSVFIEYNGTPQSISFLDESFFDLAKHLVLQCYKLYQDN